MLWRVFFLVVQLSLLVGPVVGESLETSFFSAEVPDGWAVSRTASGLWSFTSPRSERLLEVTVLPVRLSTTPQVYLQATGKLWRLRGEIESLDLEDSLAVFLLKPKDGSEQWQLKVARWQDHDLLMVTAMFPVKHLREAKATALSFTGNLVFYLPQYHRAALEKVVREGLQAHRNGHDGLDDLQATRTEMAAFRVDWEPFFPHSKPRLYTAYLAYLESRFDASFALLNRERLGMPETLIAERMKAVHNRAQEVGRALESPDSDVDGL